MITDEVLCAQARAGDTTACEVLARRYARLSHAVAREYLIPGCDHDDQVQITALGLLKAVRLYNDSRGMSFGTYLRFSMRGEIVTALKSATRIKRRPDAQPVSLDQPIPDGDEDGSTLSDVVAGPRDDDPCQRLLDREAASSMAEVLALRCSPREQRAVVERAAGFSYEECTGTQRSVDNSLQRVRRKLAA